VRHGTIRHLPDITRPDAIHNPPGSDAAANGDAPGVGEQVPKRYAAREVYHHLPGPEASPILAAGLAR
jgi:hypothetical protein